MQKFRITGINTRTGEALGIEVEAESLEQARALAAKRGLRHIAIVALQAGTESATENTGPSRRSEPPRPPPGHAP